MNISSTLFRRLMQPWIFSLFLLVGMLGSLHGQSLPGLSIVGTSFTYDAPDGQVTGIIRIPTGSGPFPAVLISHGKGGAAGGFSLQHANVLVNWGFACIGPNYTHQGSNSNPADNEGYCPENSRRARRCLDILASASSVDISRLALFGHSMGSFLTGGLSGEIPAQIKAACISAGGTSGTTDAGFASPATQEVQGITAPFLMFHGTADTTVPPSQSVNLRNILTGNGVPQKRLLYQGIGHDIVSTNVKQADIHAIMRAWFTLHGVLAFAGNTAPSLTAAGTITVTNGTASAPFPVTLQDSETAPSSLSMQVFSTDDVRLPASAIALGGSAGARTLTFTPPAGQTGTVEVAVVVQDGQLSVVHFIEVTIQNSGQTSLNFAPEISWIADQRTTPGAAISGIAFTVSDIETAAAALNVSSVSSNPTLLPAGNISFGGSGGNRTITLTPVAGQSGMSAITLMVSDGTKSKATAFALTVATTVGGNTPPLIAAVPGETLPTGIAYGPLPVILKDTETAETSLVLTAASSNTALIPVANVALSGISWGRTVTVTPAPGQVGRATITLTVSDGVLTSSKAFLIEVVAANSPPTISDLPSFTTRILGATPELQVFHVDDGETPAADLRVSVSSSNPALLPNANIALGGSASERTLEATPLAGQTGAATVTLTVRDGDFHRRAQWLFVVTDPAAAASQFSRPRGVFILDSGGSLNYTTTFGSTISLRDNNIRSHAFVDGFTLRVAWTDLESSTSPGHYDFFMIENALQKLPAGQRLSLIIVPGDPAYIAATAGVQTWSDGGTLRATPWDGTLRERRRAMLRAMGDHQSGGIPLRDDPRLDLLDPYLPGGFTGIRDPNSTQLRNLPGYTRENLLAAVQDELRTLQQEFPGKFIQIGFWPITDGQDAAYGASTAAEWIRQQLLAEFNGITRPRVGFFMENLAAKRVGLGSETYSGTPVTSFGSALFASRDTTWNGFQMLGSWTRPFNDGHVTNTLYGTPNDAMEYAYNTYRAEYHEVYVGDIDTVSMHPAFQRWHDFYAAAITTNPDSDEDGDSLPLAWEQQHGLSPTLTHAPTLDADHDGVSLLMEYAFHLSPNLADRSELPIVMPVLNMADQQTYLEWSFLRRIDNPRLHYEIEVTSDFTTWHTGPDHALEMSAIPIGDEITERVTVRTFPSVNTSSTPRFGRVRLTVD